ncbi:hypothetical protein JOF56_000847 [Kibdelosporangium banguiense]|uniref:DUF222 domain-containing protein n=1 Tax=Kibdelosporangium banguiense TaxID=1365924 RepID=A0ABS4T7R9_9PSEU|nr:hypothetical protein [Kibdelosporangium banguiense]MBP2320462.1 hypothetical protein [Kibdelosporangium banguiense]
MTVARHGRSSGTDGAARLVPDDPAAIADEVTRLAVTLPLDYSGTLSDITALLVVDPRNTAHIAAIAEAIISSALADPFYETTANRWRPLVPTWVRVQSMSGATVNVLIRLGILVGTGRYVRCDNTTKRNVGKLQPVYALDVVALRDLLSRSAGAVSPAESA